MAPLQDDPDIKGEDGQQQPGGNARQPDEQDLPVQKQEQVEDIQKEIG